MNNSDDDNIRPPDKVKQDRLIDNDFDYNNIDYYKNPMFDNKYYDIDTALKISKNEFDSIQEQEEIKAIELIYKKIKEERQNKFDNVKIQLNKIIVFDRNNLNCYELVLSIIEMYELGLINEYKTNNNQYTNIFTLLKTIRLPKDEFENLKKLIICE